MTIPQEAIRKIPPATNETTLKYRHGETRDIIKEVLSCYRDSKMQLKDFAPYLKGRTLDETCRNIWQFWKKNIRYKVDEEGLQWIKTPAAVWSSKYCDCKSFSVAVAATLYSLGIPGKFRFTSYGSNYSLPTHVYVVAQDEGREIIIDCVWTAFNSQKPFAKNWDYNMTAIYRISGLETASRKGQLDIDVHDRGLTHAELDLALDKQRLEMEQIIARKKHGIGSLLDDAYQTEIEAHNAALGSIGRARGKAPVKKSRPAKAKKAKSAKVKKAAGTVKKRKGGLLKKIGKGLKKVVGAPLRLAAKTQLPKNAPFFLYLFITDEKVLKVIPDTVRTKRQAALKYKSILVDKLAMKEGNFNKIIRNGIMNHFGKSPEEVLAKWMLTWKKTAGVGVIPAMALKAAAGGLKMLLGKFGEQFTSDVETNTPEPEDWGAVSDEVKQEMAANVQAQPSNNDPSTGNGTVRAANDGSGSYAYKSGGGEGTDEDGRTWENSEGHEDDPKGDTALAKVKDLEPVVVEAPKKPPEGEGDNTLLYAGIAAAALLLMSRKKKN